ncbi:MAG: hypothetical protein Q4C35_11990, partial [Eubacteriales bacterium]|nr:hypothetical protein [Eubacteriales bacterium]
PDPRLRRPLLYPAELQAQIARSAWGRSSGYPLTVSNCTIKLVQCQPFQEVKIAFSFHGALHEKSAPAAFGHRRAESRKNEG